MNAAYILALVLSAVSAFATLASRSVGSARLWTAIAAGLLLLILLRTDHVAVWMDILLRAQLTSHGWYSHRRAIQVAAIAVFIAVAGLSLIWILARSGKLGWQAMSATGGFAALFAFAVIRSSSLHWTDALFERQLGPAHFGQLLQAVCLAVIALSALSVLARRLIQRSR